MSEAWPSLPWREWKDTCATLHRWTQIVGKVRLARTPWINHSWHVTLLVEPRGLATPPIFAGDRAFAMAFDFLDHALRITTSDGAVEEIALEPKSVAAFHAEVRGRLDALGVATAIHTTPNEIPDAIPFEKDEVHGAYDAEHARRFFRALLTAHRLFERFRAGFCGKCSPVHFFWGSFDLAVTRFSGRPAPPHPGGIPNFPDRVAREAYSHEVSSAGFWPGGEPLPEPVFYSYAYPEPPGFRDRPVRGPGARWDAALSEFVLPWEEARRAPSPDAAVLSFLESTYEAAADAGAWDRPALEWPPGSPFARRS